MKKIIMILLTILMAITNITPIHASNADITPPQLLSVSVDKNKVEAGETVTFTVEAIDSQIGVSDIFLQLYTPITKNTYGMYLKNIGNNKYQASIKMTDTFENGIWEISHIKIKDKLNNNLDIYNGLGNNTNNIQYIDLTHCNFEFQSSNADVVPPKLISVNVDKNTAVGGDKITFTAKVTDDITGVQQVFLILNSPVTNSLEGLYLYHIGNDIYQGTLKTNDYFENGLWKIRSFILKDIQGNSGNVYNETGTNTAINQYLDLSHCDFTLSTTNQDITAPQLISLTADKKEIKIGESITFKAEIIDNQSGVDLTWLQLWFTTPITKKHDVISLKSKGNNIYEGTFTPTNYYEDGIWEVYRVNLTDKRENNASTYNGVGKDTNSVKYMDLSHCDFEVYYSNNQEYKYYTLLDGYSLNRKIPNEATSVVFAGIKAPKNIKLDDLSAQQNGRIVGWLDGTTYYISSQAKHNIMNFNIDSNDMFANKTNLKSITFNNVDASNVRNISNMFRSCSSLTSLDLSIFKNVKPIYMNGLFKGCSSLTSLDLSNLDTSLAIYMNGMFSGCSSLTSLDLSHFNTSNVTNMSEMFNGCSSLTSLDLSHFNTSNVTYMQSMFTNCKNLKTLNLNGFDTNNVTTMAFMFQGCQSLTSLDLSHFRTNSLLDMSEMFRDCVSLKTLDVSNFNTSNVTDMDSMFYNCKSLELLDLSNFNTSKIKYMSWLFARCNSLKTLNLNGFVTSNVTDMSNMFIACSSLENLYVNHFDTSNVLSMAGMFRECSSLKSLDLSNFNTSKVLYMNEMFNECNNLETIDVSNFDTNNVENMSSMFARCYKLKKLDLSSFDTTLLNTSNTVSMFAGCTSVTKAYAKTQKEANFFNITINKPANVNFISKDTTIVPGTNIKNVILSYTNVTKIVFTNIKAPENAKLMDVSTAKNSRVVAWKEGTTLYFSTQDEDLKIVFNENSSGMFFNCDKLKEIVFDNVDTSRVKDMSSMFNRCRTLKNLDLRNFDTSKVENMDSMFMYCEDLTSLDLHNFDTSNVTNMEGMFLACKSLVSLNVSSFNTSKVTNMAGMFQNCEDLNTLDVTNFDTRNVTDMHNMFGWCKKLKTIDLTSFDMSSVTNTDWMFIYCGWTEKAFARTQTDADKLNKSKDRMCVQFVVHKHTYNEWEITYDGKCTEDSIERSICDCGRELTRVIPAKGHHHELDVNSVIEVTCDRNGYTGDKICSCGDVIKGEVINAKGHNYISEIVSPTCTKYGYTIHRCECGDSYIDSYISALGHSYGEWITITEATCTHVGELSRKCKNCDVYDHRIIEQTKHKYNSIVTNPTCEEMGYTSHRCECGDSYIDNYTSALGHSYGEWITITEATCTHVGELRRYCNNCHHSELNIIPEKGHTFINYIPDNNATHLEDGTKTAKCEHCDATDTIIEVGTKIILGDIDGDGKMNQLDRVVLSRYLAKWKGYESINPKNVDINLDGKVNQLDRVILSRHLAKWKGYEELPYTK